MKNLSLLTTLSCLVSICASGVNAQSYNANGADSRIIYGGNGLSTPSGSYIGGGTMSQSARGIPQGGAQANPLLPKVPWGANVGTAGDNQYSDHPISAASPQPGRPQGGGGGGGGAAVGGRRLPGSAWGANIGTAGDGIRSDMNPGYYRSNQSNQQFVQGQMRMQQQYQPPSQIQQMIEGSHGGPLRYDGGHGGY